VVQRDSIARFDYLTREELPLLLGHLGRNLVEQVDHLIFHYLLMQRAVSRLVIVKCIFPAGGELTRLTFAVLDVLAEVDTFLR